MRTIKFRAWDKNSKKMIQPHDGDFIKWHAMSNWKDCLEIMQFTGLHDKNGKEIYFGDIVSKYHNEEDEEKDVRVVEQLEGHTEIGCFNYYESGENFTVIGNIHENPELVQ